MNQVLILLIALIIFQVQSSSDVIKLTQSNFKQVLDSKIPFFVEFFAPWCGHCKALAPTWESVASNLKGNVNVGAVDCTVEQGICSKYGVQGYPTLKLFKGGKPIDYQQGRDARSIIGFAVNNIESHVVKVTDEKEDKFWEKNSDVPHVLLISTKSKVATLYKSLAMRFKDTLVLGQTKDSEGFDERYGITSYPSLLVFSDREAEPVKYEGDIDPISLRNFLSEFAGEEVVETSEKPKKPVVPPRKKELKVQQFTTETIEQCKLCIVAFVDSKDGDLTEEDKSILENLSQVYKADRSKLTLGWLEQSESKDLQSKFNDAKFAIYRPKNQKYTTSEFTTEETVRLVSRALTGDAKWESIE